MPLLYGAIYKFRKAHAGTTIGTNIVINSAFPLFFEPLSPLSKLKGLEALDRGTLLASNLDYVIIIYDEPVFSICFCIPLSKALM